MAMTKLAEQIHLRRLRRFDLQHCRGRGRLCAGRLGWFGMAVEKFLQLLEIFFQRGEQVALVECGCGV